MKANALSFFEYMEWHQDFRDILSRLKSKTAAGEDCIPNEVLKAGGRAMAAQLGDLALKVWQQQDTPIAWRGSVMATVPRSGPQDICESWRGVLTASTMGKAFASCEGNFCRILSQGHMALSMEVSQPETQRWRRTMP